MKISLKALKSGYPQPQKIYIDPEAQALVLNRFYGHAPLTGATTDLVLTPEYQFQITTLCYALISLGFDNEKAMLINERFQGPIQKINAYFRGAPGASTSTVLPIADKIKTKLEEALYLAKGLSAQQRSQVMLQVNRYDFACADGTLLNLESICRDMSGTQASISDLIGETKYEFIHEVVHEAYIKGHFAPEYPYIGHAGGIHVIKSLVNSISEEFGLFKLTLKDDRFLHVNIAEAAKVKVQTLASEVLTPKGSQFRDAVIQKILDSLPPAPEAGADDDALILFTQNLNAYLEKLGMTKFMDLGLIKTISIKQVDSDGADEMELATGYKPELSKLLVFHTLLYLSQSHQLKTKEITQKILYLLQDEDYEGISNLLKAHKIAKPIQMMGKIIKESALAATGTVAMESVKNIISEEIREVYQVYELSDEDALNAKNHIKIVNAGYSEAGIENIPAAPFWLSILSRSLRLNKEKFGTDNALEYAIKNKIVIAGEHFLIGLMRNKISLQGEHCLRYLAKYATEQGKYYLKDVLKEVNTSFDRFNENEQHFLKHLGIPEHRIDPASKIEKLLTQPWVNKDEAEQEILLLLSAIPVFDPGFLKKIFSYVMDLSLEQVAQKILSTLPANDVTGFLLEQSLVNGKQTSLIHYWIENNRFYALGRALLLPGLDLNKLLIEGSEPAKENPIVLAARTQKLEILTLLLTQDKVNYSALAEMAQFKDLAKKLVNAGSADSLEIIFKHMGAYSPKFFAPDMVMLLPLIFTSAQEKLLGLVLRQMTDADLSALSFSPLCLSQALKNISDQTLLNRLFSKASITVWSTLLLDNKEGLAYFRTIYSQRDNQAIVEMNKLKSIPSALAFINNISEIEILLAVKQEKLSLQSIIQFMKEVRFKRELDLIDNAFFNTFKLENVATLTDAEDKISLGKIIFSRTGFFEVFVRELCIRNAQNIQSLDRSKFTILHDLARADNENADANILKLMTFSKHDNSEHSTLYFLPIAEVLDILKDAYARKSQHLKPLCLALLNLCKFSYNVMPGNAAAGFLNANRDEHPDFFAFIDAFLCETIANTHVEWMSDFLQALIHSKNIPVIKLYIQAFSANHYHSTLLGHYSEEGKSDPYHTLLHLAIKMKSPEVLCALMENLPRVIAKDLLLRKLAGYRTTVKHMPKENISPVGFAIHTTFPQAIPLMLIAAYDTAWQKKLPVDVISFLSDPKITPDLHRSIIEGLIQGRPAMLRVLRGVYATLPPEVNAVLGDFVNNTASAPQLVLFSNPAHSGAASALDKRKQTEQNNNSQNEEEEDQDVETVNPQAVKKRRL